MYACMQVDYCQEANVWESVDRCKQIADSSMIGCLPSHEIVTTFMGVAQKCVIKNYKKRCSMDDVSLTLEITILGNFYVM